MLYDCFRRAERFGHGGSRIMTLNFGAEWVKMSSVVLMSP